MSTTLTSKQIKQFIKTWSLDLSFFALSVVVWPKRVSQYSIMWFLSGNLSDFWVRLSQTSPLNAGLEHLNQNQEKFPLPRNLTEGSGRFCFFGFKGMTDRWHCKIVVFFMCTCSVTFARITICFVFSNSFVLAATLGITCIYAVTFAGTSLPSQA